MEKVDSVEIANAMPVIGDDDDMIYYQDIVRYLEDSKFPDSAPEVYRKQIQKRASKHLLSEGVLYFKKRKRNLQVIIEKEERTKLLQSLHVDKQTAAHLGLRKVHDALVQNYYWRTCYTDASNIVKQCSECSESMSLTLNLSSREELALELAPSQVQTLSAWQQLELRVHGPYPPTNSTHTHIVSLHDPSSYWVAATAAPADNLPEHIARFMLRTFCDFGPAPCHFIGNDSQLYQQVQAHLVGKMLGSLSCRQLLRQGNLSPQSCGPPCKWIAKLEELILGRPTDWDDQIAQFFWQLRTTPRDTAQLSAFVIMFGREPNDSSSVLTQSSHLISTTTNVEAAPADLLSIHCQALETSTSLPVPPTRRRLRNAFWQCRHCHQDFTSKVSFNIHQRMHIEEAKRRGALEGEEPWPASANTPRMNIKRTFLRKKSRLSKWAELARSRARHTTTNNEMTLTRDSPPPDETTTTTHTVAAVKALLALTKDERNKRGKYRKYTPDLRDEIARYAIARGVCDTTRVFSNKLGFNVSESSVRNFVKAYTNFTPELKEEIGKTAFQSGMEATQQLYANKLGRELRPAIIRKFKRVYLRKHPELPQTDTSPSPVSSQRRSNGPRRSHGTKTRVINHKRIFCPSMKDEMGRFAAEHGVPATVEHYSDKLQFAVKESTVRKFRKKYLDALNALSPAINSENHHQAQPAEMFPQPMSNLESELEVMHHQSSSLTLLHPNQHPPYSHPHPAPYHPPPPAPGLVGPSREMPHYGQLHSHQPIDHNLEGTAYDCPPLYSHASNYPVSLTNQTHQLPEYAEPSPLAFHHNQSSFLRQRVPLPVALGSQPSVSNHNSYSHHAISPAYHLPAATGAVTHVSLLQQQQQHPHMLLPPPPTFQQHLSMASNHANAHSLQVQPALLPLPLSLERKSVTTVLPDREEEPLLPGSASAVAGAEVSNLYQHHLRKADTDKNLITAPTYSPAFQPQHISLLPAPAYSNSNNQQLQPNKGMQHRDLLAEAAADLQPMSSCGPVTPSIHCPVEAVQTGTARPQRLRRANTRNLAELPSSDEDEEDEEEEEDDEEEVYEEERVQGGTRARKPARRSNQQRRGNYATYSPELRAEIGKYAIEHGNQKAMVYFKENLGLDIPESTIRGLRDKYVVKRVQRGEKEVTSLGFAQRGRPMRLGKYDGMVQDCIRQLIKSGEKISSFLAIATAKQVLMQHEPALLEENGGSIKLNPTWAKSFLKRMGANNLA